MMNGLSPGAVSVLLYAVAGVGLAWADDAPGFVDRLSKLGVTPSLLFDGEAAYNAAGGVKPGATVFSTLHVQLAFDGEKLAGLTGVTGFLDALWINGGQPDQFVGDAQGVSSIAAHPALRLYEAWLQYNTPRNDFSVLAGRYDLNTEFYHLRSAGLFINSSFGIGPEFGHSGVGGPSIFPDTSLGVRFAYKPAANAVLRFAVMDGAPADPQAGSPSAFNSHNGVLLVGEAAYVTRGADKGTPGSDRFRIGRQSEPASYDDKIAVGAWYYTASFNDLSAASGIPSRHQGEGGAYLVGEHLLFQSENDPKQRVSGFIQLGVADQVVGRFGSYIGAGLAASGLIPRRPDDQLGIAMAMARNGFGYIEGQQQMGLPVNAAETAIELSYLAQIASWVSVEPDIQYVIHPNTDPRITNALVGQIRLEIKF